jgi:transposase
MGEPITYVGIDAHARELQLAMLIDNADQPINWTSPTDARALERLRRKLEREAPGRIECCYEAGPSGYALQRRLTSARIRCQVIAPSLIPREPGDRVKTNRRDARKLARLLRAGLLTVVQPPTPAQEAVRDLGRARDDVRCDLMRARHRLSY